MTYSQALNFLFHQLPMFHRVGPAAYKPGLQRIQRFLDLIGNPECHGKYVHVAGTNGKGSTSHMLASVLMESGYRTGLFTSPHLTDFRERIKVNGRPIPKSAVCRFVEVWQPVVKELQPSFFEWTTALAFWWFQKMKCHISVIEVGMGGRLDSTNVILPQVSVITHISFDHMQFLGNSLSVIAREKAGIIKSGIPVVVGNYQKEVAEVFQKMAMEVNAPIMFADRKIKIKNFMISGSYARLEWLDGGRSDSAVCGLSGLYQKKNLPGVLATLNILGNQGWNLSPPAIRRGLKNVIKNTGLQGRWQTVAKNPLTILDTGHNEGGIRQVVRQAKSFKKNKYFYIFGVVQDKDMEKIFRHLPKTWYYLLVKPEVERGRNAEELAVEFVKHGYRALVCYDVKNAFKAALQKAKKNDMILVGGSTFVVADFLKFFQKQ